MSTDKLDSSLELELAVLKQEGRAKASERIIQGYVPPEKDGDPGIGWWGLTRCSCGLIPTPTCRCPIIRT